MVSEPSIICVTKQHYVSIFFTRLWSVGTDLIFDTQNFQRNFRKCQQIQKQTVNKNEAKTKKMTFLSASLRLLLKISAYRQ